MPRGCLRFGKMVYNPTNLAEGTRRRTVMELQDRAATLIHSPPQLSEAEQIRLMDYPDSTEEIPTLDMSPYLRGEPGGRERVAAQLREVTETIGFFYLKGHGIPQSLIDRVFEQSRRFYSLPEEVKSQVPWVDV